MHVAAVKQRQPHVLVIVRVPEVEPYVSRLRERFDPAARRGLGAHVTLLHMALPPGGMDPSMSTSVASIAAAATPFAFTVTRVARIATTLYLAVEPAEPFASLHRSLTALAPGAPSAGTLQRDFMPHISVVRRGGGADLDDRAVGEAESELNQVLARHGPIQCVCRELVLLEDSTGTWQPVQTYAYGRS
jgi:2'-5' RNA ligase